MTNNRVIGVTVTYGDRLGLVRQVVQSARDNGISRMVLVDNGARPGVAAALTDEFGGFVEVVDHHVNRGSAEGFRSGLQRALELGAHYVLLLDDDNRLRPGCLESLKSGLEECQRDWDVPREKIAVAGFRPEHHADVAAGLPGNRINPRAGSFFGFHVLDIPYKIWRRTGWARRSAAMRPVPRFVTLDVAPWSGLFFHVDVVTKFGLPRSDFVLYADDTEFTWRISADGGKVVLCTDALIEDLDRSWNVKGRTSNSLDGLILGNGDLRVYYGVRNRTYFEQRCMPASIWWRLNRAIYIAMLGLNARRRERLPRWQLIRRAVADGDRGALGICPQFPLQDVGSPAQPDREACTSLQQDP